MFPNDGIKWFLFPWICCCFFYIDLVPVYNLCCSMEAVVFTLEGAYESQVWQNTEYRVLPSDNSAFLHGARNMHIQYPPSTQDSVFRSHLAKIETLWLLYIWTTCGRGMKMIQIPEPDLQPKMFWGIPTWTFQSLIMRQLNMMNKTAQVHLIHIKLLG